MTTPTNEFVASVVKNVDKNVYAKVNDDDKVTKVHLSGYKTLWRSKMTKEEKEKREKKYANRETIPKEAPRDKDFLYIPGINVCGSPNNVEKYLMENLKSKTLKGEALASVVASLMENAYKRNNVNSEDIQTIWHFDPKHKWALDVKSDNKSFNENFVGELNLHYEEQDEKRSSNVTVPNVDNLILLLKNISEKENFTLVKGKKTLKKTAKGSKGTKITNTVDILNKAVENGKYLRVTATKANGTGTRSVEKRPENAFFLSDDEENMLSHAFFTYTDASKSNALEGAAHFLARYQNGGDEAEESQIKAAMKIVKALKKTTAKKASTKKSPKGKTSTKKTVKKVSKKEESESESSESESESESDSEVAKKAKIAADKKKVAAQELKITADKKAVEAQKAKVNAAKSIKEKIVAKKELAKDKKELSEDENELNEDEDELESDKSPSGKTPASSKSKKSKKLESESESESEESVILPKTKRFSNRK